MTVVTKIGCLGLISALGCLLLAAAGTTAAETDAEKARAEAEARETQKALTAEVRAKPFSATETAEINSYIASALEKNLVPGPYKGTVPWRAGMTCAHLRGYYARRDCRYYRRYHGRYYPE